MKQARKQTGSSAGVNCFISVSLKELCALKSYTWQPTDLGLWASSSRGVGMMVCLD